ncbi:MAG: RlmE family RNA methyltransferase [Holosporales bacterium]|jgi:23S rRNA (uridine2552-2'-O)-methyltransferase|nr:RlmE family RNA methyltransferase [Holosporales bacterium]
MKHSSTNKSLKQSSRNWITRHVSDPYVIRAKKDGYRSRAAYKLIEIQEKYKIIRHSAVVLDLGAAPGGWSQVASNITHNIIAIDILAMDPIPNVKILCGDFTDPDVLLEIEQMIGFAGGIDVILSDMCPNTCGIKKVDHLRSVRMLEEVGEFSIRHLRAGGNLAIKVFQGGAELEILNTLKKKFQKVSYFKPKSSRPKSPEMYLVGREFNA